VLKRKRLQWAVHVVRMFNRIPKRIWVANIGEKMSIRQLRNRWDAEMQKDNAKFLNIKKLAHCGKTKGWLKEENRAGRGQEMGHTIRLTTIWSFETACEDTITPMKRQCKTLCISGCRQGRANLPARIALVQRWKKTADKVGDCTEK
jgi:hypothetical protein